MTETSPRASQKWGIGIKPSFREMANLPWPLVRVEEEPHSLNDEGVVEPLSLVGGLWRERTSDF